MKITASSQVIVNGDATVMERRGSRQKQTKGSCEYRVESGKVWLNFVAEASSLRGFSTWLT